ncbi:MAG: arylsulfatase [Phycisphaerae bacterium]|nr:arylsulfatase [Phycisphaerae bacterium]
MIGKPNVIIINADDLGYGDIGCYGATKVKTPNIDKLAKQGRMFTDAHTASAVCTPSRYGLLTGSYPLRKNLWGPSPVRQGLLIDPEKPTLASIMKKAGYATSCIGKWHLGFGEQEPDWNGELKPGPLELGFDYYFGIPQVNSGPPFVYVENHQVVGLDPSDPLVYGKKPETQAWPAKGYKSSTIGGARAAHELYKDEEIATKFKDKAIGWIKQNKTKPFFMYLATTNIHHPFTPAPRFKGTSECGIYGDFIHELDWVVGEIMQCLEDTGQVNNTLLIFTSDNGGMLNHGGQDAWKAGHHLNGELLGFKFGAWEGGHRTPMIARWPGKIQANSKSDQLISQIDMLATLAALTNQSLADNDDIDSVNQLEAFIGNPKNSIREYLIISPNSPQHLLVLKGNWVYIPAQNEGGFQGTKIGDHTLGGAAAHKLTGQVNSDISNGKIKADAPPGQLYNLKNDTSQQFNVYNKHSEIVAELDKLIKLYRSKIGPEPKLGWINIKPVKK